MIDNKDATALNKGGSTKELNTTLVGDQLKKPSGDLSKILKAAEKTFLRTEIPLNLAIKKINKI